VLNCFVLFRCNPLRYKMKYVAPKSPTMTISRPIAKIQSQRSAVASEDAECQTQHEANPSTFSLKSRGCKGLAYSVIGLALLTVIIAFIQNALTTNHLMKVTPDAAIGNPKLMEFAEKRGAPLFRTHCASCHGEDGKGNTIFGVPNLTDRDWLTALAASAILKRCFSTASARTIPGMEFGRDAGFCSSRTIGNGAHSTDDAWRDPRCDRIPP